MHNSEDERKGGGSSADGDSDDSECDYSELERRTEEMQAGTPTPTPTPIASQPLSKTAQRRKEAERAAATAKNAQALEALLPCELESFPLPGLLPPQALQQQQPLPWPSLLHASAHWTVKTVKGLPGIFWVAGAVKAAAVDRLTAACLDNWGGRAQPMPQQPAAPQTAVGETQPKRARERQRLQWSTLGYHYDWTRKVYDRESHSPFPPSLARACQAMAAVLGLGAYEAQAGIVNFYDAGANLCPHVDEAEHDRRRPLFSFSLGLPALFIVGGPTLNHRPAVLRIQRYVQGRRGGRQEYPSFSQYCQKAYNTALTTSSAAMFLS